jgi:heptosyltransferase-2
VAALRQYGFNEIFQLGTQLHHTVKTARAFEMPGAISLVDQLTLPECIAMISGADLFIGIDSGLLHIAASVGTTSVSLWGPTAPLLRFSPRKTRLFMTGQVPCLACHHRKPRLHWITGCPHEINCMKQITVEEVFQNCLSALAFEGT